MTNAADNLPLPSPKSRITHLDALRGWASLMVVLCHVTASAPLATIMEAQEHWWLLPVRLITNGDAAVIIFFLLSGYVLALPFFDGKPPSYPSFLLKRICRLYMPFAVVIGLAIGLFHTFDVSKPIEDIGPWFTEHAANVYSAFLTGHFLMLGRYQDTFLDTPTWTLVHEMRIAFIFPVLVYVCRNTRTAIWMGAIDLLISALWLSHFGQIEPWGPDSISLSLVWTLRIIPYFLIGILLCKHSGVMRKPIKKLSAKGRWVIFIAALLVFVVPHSYTNLIDAMYTVSAVILIMFPFEMRMLGRSLNGFLSQGLGRISYSIYLIHVPLLLVTFSMLWGHYSYSMLVLIFLGILLVGAICMYLLVEMPAIKLGRWLGRKL